MSGDQRWPLWRVRLAYLGRLAKRVFVYGDTTTIRALMCISSLGFAGGLWPSLGAFNRPAFVAMSHIAPWWAWALAFLLHAAGVIWRFIDPVPRGGWAFAVNAWGFGLWALYVGLLTMTLGEYTPSSAMEITVVVAAFVALIRTGLNEEAVTP